MCSTICVMDLRISLLITLFIYCFLLSLNKADILENPLLLGPRGVPGVKGGPGLRGPSGGPGPAGSAGAVGSPGDPGPKGDRGVRGPDGAPGSSTGLPGVPGDLGLPGPVGPRGGSGVKGLAGEDGFSGYPGDKGEPGLASPPGSKGVQGQQGAKGMKGASGPVGIQGSKGEPGLPGDVRYPNDADCSECDHGCSNQRDRWHEMAARADIQLQLESRCTCKSGYLLFNRTYCVERCLINNGGCQHTCISSATSSKLCSCNKGFVLASDQLSCVDIDECLPAKDGGTDSGDICDQSRKTGESPQQICVNAAGTHECLTRAQYSPASQPEDDGKSGDGSSSAAGAAAAASASSSPNSSLTEPWIFILLLFWLIVITIITLIFILVVCVSTMKRREREKKILVAAAAAKTREQSAEEFYFSAEPSYTMPKLAISDKVETHPASEYRNGGGTLAVASAPVYYSNDAYARDEFDNYQQDQYGGDGGLQMDGSDSMSLGSSIPEPPPRGTSMLISVGPGPRGQVDDDDDQPPPPVPFDDFDRSTDDSYHDQDRGNYAQQSTSY